MTKLAAILVLVSGCASSGVVRPPETFHWCAEERPAHVVISDLLPAECALAVCDGVLWWAEQGPDYITCAVVPDDSLTPDHPDPRFIQVTANPPENAGASGDTRVHLLTPNCVDSAEIRFDPYWCRPGSNTAAHELGHALGLTHNSNTDNLMWPGTLYQGWELTDEQLERVR